MNNTTTLKTTPIMSRLRRWSLAAAIVFCFASLLRAGWAEDAIKKECDYIVNCSFTTLAVNNAEAQVTDDAYGAINVVRIASSGADWVNPGESAVAVIGLMDGAKKLRSLGFYPADVSRYEAVMSAFFNLWVNDPASGLFVASGADIGGVRARVHYTKAGACTSGEHPTAAATGQIIVASWKYYEYLASTGRQSQANAWLAASAARMQAAGAFLNASYHSTHKLCASRPGVKNISDIWLNDSAWAQPAFKALARYQAKGHIPAPGNFNYTTRAGDLVIGMGLAKDNGTRKNFFRYRERNNAYAPTYGDRIDQLCFVPYETDSVPPSEDFCGSVSNWWTTGGTMTLNHTNSSLWTYYGTKWKHFFAGSEENNRLTPGPGLQLAKVEWKHYKATGNTAYRTRAEQRFTFARSTARSNLWMGARAGWTEAGVANGITDWRDANTKVSAPTWQRFADTSAYFIQVLIMVTYDEDCTVQPLL